MSKAREVINELLVDIYNDILQIEEQYIKERGITDLTITEIHTIDAIGIKSTKTMSEIAKSLKVTQGTLTTCINKLIRKGYVERNRIEEDRRVVLIKLTEKGKEVFKFHKLFHEEMIHNTVEDLDGNEKDVLINSLSKIKNFFSDKYEL